MKDFSKFIVTLVIIMNVVFTTAVLFIFWHTQEEPNVLITAWFAFTTGEVFSLAAIKRKKIDSEGYTGKVDVDVDDN